MLKPTYSSILFLAVLTNIKSTLFIPRYRLAAHFHDMSEQLNLFFRPPLFAAEGTAPAPAIGLCVHPDNTLSVVEATAPDCIYTYNPYHNLLSSPRSVSLRPDTPIALYVPCSEDVLDYSLCYCLLSQLKATALGHPAAQQAFMQSVTTLCPFPPLIAASQLLFTRPFAEFTAQPVATMWLLQDYLLCVAKAVLPEIIPDEMLSRKLNLCLAKLLHDHWNGIATATTTQLLTLQQIGELQSELFKLETLELLNFIPSETYCPHTSAGLVLLKCSDDVFVIHAAAAGDDGTVLRGPATATFTTVTDQGQLDEKLADAALLQDLELAYYFATLSQDTRITQLDVIVVDCSGSMDQIAFSHDADMRRSDAAQVLFNMVVDKYRSLELSARVACVLFGSTVSLACNFTADLVQFETLLGRAGSMGMTKLWDALIVAAEAMNAERDNLSAQQLLHPDCRCRILAVTDGEDNQSARTNVDIARLCREKNILLDAFVLGMVNDEPLRTAAAATGGVTLSFRDIQDASELFEQPFVVNVSARSLRDLLPVEPISVFADEAAFPRVTSSTVREHVSTPPAAAAMSGTSSSVTPSSAPAPGPTSSTSTNGAMRRRLMQEIKVLVKGGGAANGIVAMDCEPGAA